MIKKQQMPILKANYLLDLHSGNFHPTGHPPSHNPVTLSHFPLIPQFMLQFSLQL